MRYEKYEMPSLAEVRQYRVSLVFNVFMIDLELVSLADENIRKMC